MPKRTDNRSSAPAQADRTERARLVHDLGERVKELTALYQTARIVHDDRLELPQMLERLAALLPPAFQYPEITAAAVRYGDHRAATPGFGAVPWTLTAAFQTRDGTSGAIDVAYLQERPASAEGPFLAEERWLLDSLADILTTALERRHLENQFRQSQKMEAMGRLAGGVAHDFNNLLTAIKGYSEFVIDSLEHGDRRRRDVEEIAKAADRAAALTQRLLAFSRHQVLAPRVIDPNNVIAGMEKLLRRLIGAHIELRVELLPQTVAIKVDPGQLEQVLMNLAVNARDAMPRGGVLTIETSLAEFDERVAAARAELPPGRYVMIAVTDTGSGMSAATRARLFEPFFTTKEQGRGTGLGLATVYGIVRQSGGVIWVYSEPGKGASFKVYLPRVESEIEPVSAAAAPAGSLHGDETVLFVDDDPQVRALAERALVSRGYHALVSGDPDEALRQIENVPIHLLVTDIVMPRVAGPELARRVRAVHPRARVLYITGYTERAVEEELTATATILRKPFTPSGLLRCVREVLDASDASVAAQ